MSAASERGPQSPGVTLLAIGDVHLGTRPTRLPRSLLDWSVDPRDLTPEAALRATVDLALAERVDAVLLAGDVVDGTNARFEAIRPLEEALQRLGQAGIPVVGVAGNHDVEALPRLARLTRGFRLLGEGGRWSSWVLEKQGRPVLEILGWSFPERSVRYSPLRALLQEPPPPARPGIPRLGLMHGDLDAPATSPYAPFSRREAEAAGLDGWLLGHVHRPSLARLRAAPGSGPFGYLGSLLGLDPSETGPHGPWLIEMEPGGSIQARQRALAPLRWERVELRLPALEAAEDLGDLLLEEATRQALAIREQSPVPRALGLRLRLVGPVRHFEAIHRQIAAGRWADIARAVDDTVVFVEKLVDCLELDVDLRKIAQGDDPPALLARRLLVLREGGAERARLLEQARRALREVAQEPRWSPLEQLRHAEDPLSDEALASALQQAGNAALHQLLAQRPSAPGEPS